MSRGFPPDVSESLLQNILCLFGVIHHSERHPVKGRGEALVERGKRRIIAFGNAVDQPCLKLVLGLLRQPGHTACHGLVYYLHRLPETLLANRSNPPRMVAFEPRP